MRRDRLLALTVCVDFGDVLELCLPMNRCAFEEVVIVTTPQDEAAHRVARRWGAHVFETEAFYLSGAYFNKWRALNEALRQWDWPGWYVLLDADILLPAGFSLQGLWRHTAYGMRRRICKDWQSHGAWLFEATWGRYPESGYSAPAGYLLCVHREHPRFPRGAWFPDDIHNAAWGDDLLLAKLGGALMLPGYCLHLGLPEVNWYGRAMAYVDGRPGAFHDRVHLKDAFRALCHERRDTRYLTLEGLERLRREGKSLR